jgi:hypothetical protein
MILLHIHFFQVLLRYVSGNCNVILSIIIFLRLCSFMASFLHFFPYYFATVPCVCGVYIVDKVTCLCVSVSLFGKRSVHDCHCRSAAVIMGKGM